MFNLCSAVLAVFLIVQSLALILLTLITGHAGRYPEVIIILSMIVLGFGAAVLNATYATALETLYDMVARAVQMFATASTIVHDGF